MYAVIIVISIIFKLDILDKKILSRDFEQIHYICMYIIYTLLMYYDVF